MVSSGWFLSAGIKELHENGVRCWIWIGEQRQWRDLKSNETAKLLYSVGQFCRFIHPGSCRRLTLAPPWPPRARATPLRSSESAARASWRSLLLLLRAPSSARARRGTWTACPRPGSAPAVARAWTRARRPAGTAWRRPCSGRRVAEALSGPKVGKKGKREKDGGREGGRKRKKEKREGKQTVSHLFC